MDSRTIISELLVKPEGEHLQLKEAKTSFSFSEALKNCCALANSGGGQLVLGISDKRPRTVVGSQAFPQPERTREDLMNNLHIGVDFQLHAIDGKRVLIFDVASRPVGQAVYSNGEAWRFHGDSLTSLSSIDLQAIFAESGHDYSGDSCNGASMRDLSAEAMDDFRAKWVAKTNYGNYRNMSHEELMRACEAVVDQGVTYAALILFGTREALGKYLPNSEIIFEYRSSDASGPAQYREEFRTGFFSCYDRIWELINLRNDKQHHQEGLFIFDIPTFNERVVREALLNAVSHRNYQLPGSIFVRQYPDRLVIDSPGGFPRGVTLENLLERQSPRNRRIADILAKCGLVERSGQGMNLIYEWSVKEGKALPDFSGTDDYLVRITLNGTVIEQRMLTLIGTIGTNRMESMSTDDILAINMLYHGKKPLPQYKQRLSRLVDLGLVEHIGRNKFVLSRGLYESVGLSGVHTKRVGLDKDTNKEMIYRHIKKSGTRGAPMREFQQVLPSLTRNQIHGLLRELAVENRIRVEGVTRSARWFSNNG